MNCHLRGGRSLNVLLLNELQRQEHLNQLQQERIDALEQRLNELLNSGDVKDHPLKSPAERRDAGVSRLTP